MPDKPQIEKLRVLHDLDTQFDVPEAMRGVLEGQLSQEDRQRRPRFFNGFRIEDWFKWIFSALPWVRLIHGLGQQQFPALSKATYQVPDYMLLVETSGLVDRPLLVEVKLVPRNKSSLKLPCSQVDLCAQYATRLGMPLVYAVYWECFSMWTLNTLDTFERKSTSRKLQMMTGIEADCSNILGDMSFFVPPALVRTSSFSKRPVAEPTVTHPEYGHLITSVASHGDRVVNLEPEESAVIDSMVSMKLLARTCTGDEETELVEAAECSHLLKLSSWITRHLATFKVEPSETDSNLSARVISNLMETLDCPRLPMGPPPGRSPQLDHLQELFCTTTQAAE